MLRFYFRLIKGIPSQLFESYGLATTISALALSVVTFFNRELGRKLSAEWDGVSSWWAAGPVGAVFLYGMLRANYVAHERLRRRLTRERRRRREQAASYTPPPINLTVNVNQEQPAAPMEPAALLVGPAGPTNLAAEDYLLWWHINVVSLEPMPLEGARVFLRPEHGQPTLNLMWPSEEGPVEEITLHPSSPVPVPVAVRSTRADVALSGDPTRLGHFPVPQWVCRVTDRRAFVFQRDFTDMQPQSGLIFRLVVRAADGREARTPIFSLLNPAADEPNTRMVLSMIYESCASA